MNPRKRTVLILFIALLSAGLLWAEGKVESDPGSVGTAAGYPLTVTDDLGVRMTLQSKPKRIVSVTMFTDEVLLELVDSDRLIAVTTFAEDPAISNIAEKAAKVPNKVTLNVEILLSLRPDLIFVANWSEADKVEQLRNAGIKVFLLESALTIENIQQKIAIVAKVVGEVEKGKILIDSMDSKIATIQATLSGLKEGEKLTVLDYAVWGSSQGEGSSWSEMLDKAGLINAVADFPADDWGQVPVSKEKLVELNPDILILPGWVYGDPEGAKNFFAQILDDPALRHMKAVTENKAYMMPEKLKTTTSQYIVDAIEYLVRTAYPTLFN